MVEKHLKLYRYVDGVNDTPFPNAIDQIEISKFTYEASRMGAAPTITATIMHPTCLDGVLKSDIYTLFRGEKYFVKQAPTSSYDNTDSRYRHSVDFTSERAILDDVYFLNVVRVDNLNIGDVVESNNPKFSFYGDIHEFARRIALSMSYSNLGYSVEVDEGVESEEVQMTFENNFLTEAIQTSYENFKIPYYFVGKTLHFGDAKGSVNTTSTAYEYGIDNELISVTKENANYKLVNRASAFGSERNIPYYYPNATPSGSIYVETSSPTLAPAIVNDLKASQKIGVGNTLTYKGGDAQLLDESKYSHDGVSYYSFRQGQSIGITSVYPRVWISCPFRVTEAGSCLFHFTHKRISDEDYMSSRSRIESAFLNGIETPVERDGDALRINLQNGDYTLIVGLDFSDYSGSVLIKFTMDMDLKWVSTNNSEEFPIGEDIGITYATPTSGDTLTLVADTYIKPSSTLMPSKYRNTLGKEMFYNATDGTYMEDDGSFVIFPNPYSSKNPREHIFSIEDIYPTITNAKNADNERFDLIADVAFDENDSNETYEDEDGNITYKHPYFFVKLKKMNFNLFEQAIEDETMKLSFTTGHCGACEFEIGVDEDNDKNTVQVDASGNLLRDENGRVVCGLKGYQPAVKPQERQNDTLNNSVWIALKKEDSTYGTMMPDKVNGIVPKQGDAFVLLGINLPLSYILDAEKRLEKEIVKYLKDNNEEKFNFSISFSSIFFAENENALLSLDENHKLYIKYNGLCVEQYISSFTYAMEEDSVLPSIRVELSESLVANTNVVQNAMNEVKATLGKTIGKVETDAAIMASTFLNKTTDDKISGVVEFARGFKSGEGGKMEVLGSGESKLTIDYLEVLKYAKFHTIETESTKHIGGRVLISNATMVVDSVEKEGSTYKCYIRNEAEGGNRENYHSFVVGDLVISQTINAWKQRYYWCEVVGVGKDYITISEASGKCDAHSMPPITGDTIVQLGNRTDTKRQSAIILSSYGDKTPSLVMYTGINTFTLEGKEINGFIYKEAEDGRYESYFFNYGSMLLGAKDTTDENANYIEYTHSESGGGVLKIKGDLELNPDSTLSQTITNLATSTEDLNYLKEAIKNGTTISGGLILTSLIQLGQLNGDSFNVHSGISGVYDPNDGNGGIAAWFGGKKIDAQKNPEAVDGAKSLFRMDGTGYLAGGDISWDKNGNTNIEGNITAQTLTLEGKTEGGKQVPTANVKGLLAISDESGITTFLDGSASNAIFGAGVSDATYGSAYDKSLAFIENQGIGEDMRPDFLIYRDDNGKVKVYIKDLGVNDDEGGVINISALKTLIDAKLDTSVFEDAFVIHRNPSTNEIESIEAKAGLWSNSFISALGKNSESGGGSGTAFTAGKGVELVTSPDDERTLNVRLATGGGLAFDSNGNIKVASGFSSDKSYTHSQDTPSAEWVIEHRLGKIPSVTIINSNGDVVMGNVNIDTTDPLNKLTISFKGEFSGKAIMN